VAKRAWNVVAVVLLARGALSTGTTREAVLASALDTGDDVKVIVCVKQVPDPNLIKFNIESDAVEDVYYIANPCDMVALEEAIRIKEELGMGEVTAITLGPIRAKRVLRTCLTMGADKAIRLWDKSFENLGPHGVSIILAEAMSKLGYDLILCGKISIDEADGYVGSAIAELLNLPQVSAITRLEISPDRKKATIHRRLERGDREIVECPLPAVFTADESLAQPRYASLPTCIAGTKKEIAELDAKWLGLELGNLKPTTQVQSISQPKPRLKKGFSIDSSLSASDRLKSIMSGGIKEKKSATIEQPPEAAAGEIIRFLTQNRIIKS